MLAAADQAGAAFRTFAAMSRSLFDAYVAEGFTEETAFDVVMLWNENFARVVCGTS
jgi:hypothetical protein